LHNLFYSGKNVAPDPYPFLNARSELDDNGYLSETLPFCTGIGEPSGGCSGVRRAAGGTSSSQLHQLQMELQLQRQQAQVPYPTHSRISVTGPKVLISDPGPQIVN